MTYCWTINVQYMWDISFTHTLFAYVNVFVETLVLECMSQCHVVYLNLGICVNDSRLIVINNSRLKTLQCLQYWQKVIKKYGRIYCCGFFVFFLQENNCTVMASWFFKNFFCLLRIGNSVNAVIDTVKWEQQLLTAVTALRIPS